MSRLDITPQRELGNGPYGALGVPALGSLDISLNFASATLPGLQAAFKDAVAADDVSYYHNPAQSQDVNLSNSYLPNLKSFFNAVAADTPPTA